MARDEYGQTWWQRNREPVIVLGGFLGVFVGLMVLFIWMQTAAERHGCKVTGRKMDLQAEYSIWTGCMARIDGKWMPVDSIRKIVK